jgi:hypothetical protein
MCQIKNLLYLKQKKLAAVNEWTRKKFNMKKAYLILFTSVITAASYGQSIQNMVFNSTGGSIGAASAVHMTISVGEPAIGESSAIPGAGVAQGFLGGSKSLVSTAPDAEEVAIENASVYPNPFSSVIKINSAADNIQVSVYNIMGQQVFEGAYVNTGIDLSHLSQGMYVVHATADEKVISNTKILKQ